MKKLKGIVSMVLVTIMIVSASLAAHAETASFEEPAVQEEEVIRSDEEPDQAEESTSDNEQQEPDGGLEQTEVPISAEVQNELAEEPLAMPLPLLGEDMSDDEIIEMLFENSYDVFAQCRNDIGIYRDSILLFDGEPYHPSSIAATGIGLMSLTIADKKGWNNHALEDAKLTLKSMTGHTPGFNPDVSSNGFIRHFIDLETGAQAWNSEYSTIDTAILVTGALFAKQYFDDPELSRYADELFDSIDFQDALASLDTGGMYMIMDENGNGDPNAITLPYNEYIIVAWLAYNQHINEPDSLAVQVWEKWFQTTENIIHKDYQGFSLLTDNENRFLPSFTWLFPYYMVNMFSSSSSVYRQYVQNAYQADKLWSSNTGGLSYEWGNGAGNNMSTGYHADAIENNDELTVSPHIISGFIPVNPSGRDDLISLYRNNKGVYELPLNGKEIVWRYSRVHTDWESDSIQAIDYSTFLFGLAVQDSDLGMEFFRENNNFFGTPDDDNDNGGDDQDNGDDPGGSNNQGSGDDKVNKNNKKPVQLKQTSAPVRTGDSTNTLALIILLIISGLAATVLIVRKRLKRSEV